MIQFNPNKHTGKTKMATTNQPYRLTGHYNINDVKYDLLKIIQPYDGYMFNNKETDRVLSLFNSYLGDLRGSDKIFQYNIETTDKENAITYDIHVQMQRDRSPKKLKIHVGKLVYPLKSEEVAA